MQQISYYTGYSCTTLRPSCFTSLLCKAELDCLHDQDRVTTDPRTDSWRGIATIGLARQLDFAMSMLRKLWPVPYSTWTVPISVTCASIAYIGIEAPLILYGSMQQYHTHNLLDLSYFLHSKNLTTNQLQWGPTIRRSTSCHYIISLVPSNHFDLDLLIPYQATIYHTLIHE